MNNIYSLCTVADESDWDDLQLLLYSLSIYNPFIPIYINATERLIENLSSSELSDGRIKIKLMEYFPDSTTPRSHLVTQIMDVALSYNSNTFFVSPNTIIIKHLDIYKFTNKELSNVSAIVNKNGLDAIILKDTFVDWLKINYLTNGDFDRSTSFLEGTLIDYHDTLDQLSDIVDKATVIKTYFGKDYINTKDYFINKYNTFVVDKLFNGNDKLSKLITEKFQANKVLSPSPKYEQKINLLVQYQNVDDMERQREYDYCFHANLDNPHVEVIYNFNNKSKIPESIKNHHKYKEIQLNTTLKYSDAFKFANNELKDRTVCIINSDIFLDHTSDWKVANDITKQNIVLCLSRFEFDGTNARRDPQLVKTKFCNQQDGWIFKSPLNVELSTCNFDVGGLRSDIAISHRLKNAKYILLNNQNEFKLFHYDTKGVGSNKSNDVSNNGFYLLPDIDSFVFQNAGKVDVSIDEAAKYLGLATLQKYEIICDIFSKYVTL